MILLRPLVVIAGIFLAQGLAVLLSFLSLLHTRLGRFRLHVVLIRSIYDMVFYSTALRRSKGYGSGKRSSRSLKREHTGKRIEYA